MLRQAQGEDEQTTLMLSLSQHEYVSIASPLRRISEFP
jgi:hypothetical protein